MKVDTDTPSLSMWIEAFALAASRGQPPGGTQCQMFLRFVGKGHLELVDHMKQNCQYIQPKTLDQLLLFVVAT